MTFVFTKDRIEKAGKNLSELPELTELINYEGYFASSIYPVLEDEGYTHAATAASYDKSTHKLAQVIMQFESETGYKIDVVTYLGGQRPYKFGE